MSTSKIGIIGGTGMGNFLTQGGSVQKRVVDSEYGGQVEYLIFEYSGYQVIFLDRHNCSGNFLLPHQLNHQSYMYVLGELERVDMILATSAVGAPYKEKGGLNQSSLIAPVDAIDYVQEAYTFAKKDFTDHLAFHRPIDRLFCPHLVRALLGGEEVFHPRFTLANSIKGPRYETSAEMKIRERDGVDMVGMPTAFPEAVLAGELAIPYGLLCGVSNLAPANHNGAKVADVMLTMLPAMNMRIMRAIDWLITRGEHPPDCPCRKGREESVFSMLGK